MVKGQIIVVRVRNQDFILTLMGRQLNVLNRTETESDLSCKSITLDAVVRMDMGEREHEGKEARKLVPNDRWQFE